MTRKQLGLYLATAMIWGCTWVLILHVVTAFGGGGIALRALVGSLALLIGALATRRKLRYGPIKPLLIVAATTVAGQLLGFNLATPMVGTAMTAILAATIPMFSMVFGRFWKIEQITKLGYFGLLIGVLGVILIVGFPSVEINSTFIWGSIICVLGAISAAYGSIYTHMHLKDVGYWEKTIASFFWGGVMMLPMFLFNPPKSAPVPIDYLYLLVLGIVSTGIGYIMFFKLVSEIGATPALTVEFLVTVIAVLVGVGFLGESLSSIQIVGSIGIVLGCALVLDLLPFGPKKQHQITEQITPEGI